MASNYENKENGIYKTEKVEILLPLNINSDKIYDENKFDVKIWRDGDEKFVILKKKEQ